MNKSGEANRRVRSTRKKLKEGLIFLMKDKSVNEITVAEISRYADISRGTFYLHYSDIYALLHAVEDELLGRFETVLYTETESSQEGLVSCLTEVISFIGLNIDVFSVLFGNNNNDNYFIEKVKSLVSNRYSEYWSGKIPGSDSDRDEICEAFVMMGLFGAIKSWISNGMKEPAENIATLVADMTIRCVDLGRED